MRLIARDEPEIDRTEKLEKLGPPFALQNEANCFYPVRATAGIEFIEESGSRPVERQPRHPVPTVPFLSLGGGNYAKRRGKSVSVFFVTCAWGPPEPT